jgi:hypothetical protein
MIKMDSAPATPDLPPIFTPQIAVLRAFFTPFSGVLLRHHDLGGSGLTPVLGTPILG